MPETIAERLAQFSESLRFEDIPPAVIEKAKRLVLDTIGVSIGSTQIDFGRSALKLVARWGGAGEATPIGGHAKVPAHNAALCNGVLAHGQDYDDTHTESVVHPSAALVPATLAVAEHAGRSGRDTLTALVAGMEASIRIAMPALNQFHLRGFHTTSMSTPFGAALIAAKLEKAGLQGAVDAVGVCGSFTSGLLECVPAGAGSKRLHAGWGGMCGIIAAQLAQEEVSGPRTIFEGKLGVYNSFLRGEKIDPAKIFDGLGHKWEMLDIRPKLYPCCHYLQTYLDCALALRREENLQPDQIEAISCRVAPGAVNIVCEPWEKKLDPATGYDARFSLPFAIALMLTRGKAGVTEFSAENAGDAKIRELMKKISYVTAPDYKVRDMPGWIEVTRKDGAKLVREVPQVRGDAKNPFSPAELLDKFNANTAFLGAPKSKKIADDILALEKLADIRSLMARLAAPQPEPKRA